MFYKLKIEIEKKGNYASLAYIPDNEDTNQAKLSYFNLPDFEPVFKPIKFERGSREVDIIKDYKGSIGGKGFVISKKVKQIFENSNLPKHKIYPLTYNRKLNKDEYEQVHDLYFWIQFIFEDNYNWFDFSKTRFYLRQEIGSEFENIEIKDVDELKKYFEIADDRNMRVLFHEYLFNKNYKGQDIFYLHDIIRLPIISENLKNKLIENKVTGIEDFLELN